MSSKHFHRVKRLNFYASFCEAPETMIKLDEILTKVTLTKYLFKFSNYRTFKEKKRYKNEIFK